MRLLRIVAALGILTCPAIAQEVSLHEAIPFWRKLWAEPTVKIAAVLLTTGATLKVVDATRGKDKATGIPDGKKAILLPPGDPPLPGSAPGDAEDAPSGDDRAEVSTLESADAPEPEPEGAEAVQLVYYATDRLRRANKSYLRRFSGRRDPRQDLHYGVCKVSIPEAHVRGRHERPGFLRKEKSSKHIVFYRLDECDRSNWLHKLSKTIGDSAKDDVLVFLHGYKVAFPTAVRRTAQLAYDLEFTGAVIAYSWPSRGTLGGYPTDSQSARNTSQNLRRVLKDVCRNTGAKTVHVIAHSMGNVPLANVLALLDREIGHIVLAAPDIDATEFKNLAAKFPGSADRITLYASSKDKALKLSKRVQGNYARAGDTSGGVLVVDGVDTIDASAVDTSFMGHSYIASNLSVVRDLYELLHHNTETADRFGMIPHKVGDRFYWEYDPEKVKPPV